MGKMGRFAEGEGAFEPRSPLRCGKAANLSCCANVLRLVLPMAVGIRRMKNRSLPADECTSWALPTENDMRYFANIEYLGCFSKTERPFLPRKAPKKWVLSLIVA
jgi:hypothetical protein